MQLSQSQVDQATHPFSDAEVDAFAEMIGCHRAGTGWRGGTPERLRRWCEYGYRHMLDWPDERELGRLMEVAGEDDEGERPYVWVELAGLTSDQLKADPARALSVECLDDLVIEGIDSVTHRAHVMVFHDWRPHKLEFIRSMVKYYAERGYDIVYVSWPDDIARPAPGKTYDEWINSTKPCRQKSSATAPIPEGTIVMATDRGNYGEIVSDNGSSCTVHFKSRDGNEADVEIPSDQLRAQDGTPLDSSTIELPPITPLRKLVQDHPRLRPPVIDGLLRVGETANIIAGPKTHKSWLSYGIALSVATGGVWLDSFAAKKGRVLIVDNELHAETIAHRIPQVARATGITWELIENLVDIVPLRGTGVDLHALGHVIEAIEEGQYALVIADAWYRFLPPGTSENDNAQIMQLFNVLDGYTEKLQAAWINIHHASKGPQESKSVTDVGAGAGAQSRAADTHIILRPHEDEGVAVLEARVRSWPPVKPLAIRWEHPVWRLADGIDPKKLRRQLSAKERQRQVEDEESVRKITATFLGGKRQTASTIRRQLGIGKDRLQRLLDRMEADGHLLRDEVTKRGNVCGEYRLAPAAEIDDPEPSKQGEQHELFTDH